jgi:hypothetical protein
MGCSQGAHSKLLVDSALPFDASSEIYDFLYEDLQKKGRIVGARGITGSRSQVIERTRLGTYLTSGRIASYTSPYDLDNWLPRILGASPSGDTFALEEALPAFHVLIDRVGGAFRYGECYVNRGVFRGKAGPGDAEPELIEQIVEIIAQDETADTAANIWPGVEPTLDTSAARVPYIMADGVLTINSTDYYFQEFVLVVDNHLQPRWVNSLTPTAICPSNRTVALRVGFPFTAASDAVFSGLYDLAAAEDGVTATLVFTAGTVSTTFTFNGLQWADNSPVVQGKQEIPLYIDFISRMKGTDREIVVTNDATV